MLPFNYNDDEVQRKNATSLLILREYGGWDQIFQKRMQSFSPFIDRLEQEIRLKSHEGCVNCLEWNSNGCILASGSDDLQMNLWNPFSKKKLFSMRTKHSGNIFSVKFLPKQNDAIIATAAADKYIYVVDVHNPNETLLSCHCHAARVKRLATANDSPYIFWSAGEDGAILQLDTREHHHCRSEDNAVRLIHLQQMLNGSAEAKCLAINPLRTEYLAVGANDSYVRIFDRRLIKPISSFLGASNTMDSTTGATGAKHNIAANCCTYYCPGHLNKSNVSYTEIDTHSITYLAFNNNGTELLANMGCEQIYLYDLQNAEQSIYLDLPDYVKNDTTTEQNSTVLQECEEGAVGGEIDMPPHRRRLPANIEHYKKLGNEYLENERYLFAIEQYSEAIAHMPDCAVLYLNRATAYMRRKWFGDFYAALRDCHKALKLDPTYIKAHFRLARALLDLEHFKEAEDCLQELINRFPSYANNHGVILLSKDIKELWKKQKHNANYALRLEEVIDYDTISLSDDEFQLRSKAKDFKEHFVGHCNTTTDIKEANFFGSDNNFIVAGSDDGNFFIWERKTGKIRSIYKADSAIVNCVQPHPYLCALATSGIDHDIKIWTPIAESEDKRHNIVTHKAKCVEENQEKMKSDPFDLNPRNSFCLNG